MNFDTSDTGAAKLFVQLHSERIRWHAHRELWLAWRDGIWQDDKAKFAWLLAEETADHARAAAMSMPKAVVLDDADEVTQRAANITNKNRKAAITWADYLRSRSGIVNMLEVAKPRLAAFTAELDADPWILVCGNGTLDLKTLELRDPSPADMATKKVGVKWQGPDTKSPKWEAFLAEVTGKDEELSAYLQRVFGYCLLGEWREKAFWFAYGPPDGGKSTLLTVMASVLGDYHSAADASTWMDRLGGGNRGDIVRLAGSRLVTTSEINPDSKFDTALLKKVTGGDPLVAAAKFEGEIEFKPQFGLWLAGNDRPYIAVGDEGLWRRLRCVPFPHSVPLPQQNPKLASELLEEGGPAILAWAAKGLQAYLSDGLKSCKAVDEATAEYRHDLNPLSQFAEERLSFAVGAKTSFNELFLAYQEYADAYRIQRRVSAQKFAKALKELKLIPVKADNTRMWLGVKVRPQPLFP